MDDDADIQHIISAANPVVKLARQLASRRRARLREGLFLIEGLKAIQTAAEHGVPIQTLIIDDERRGDLPPALVSSIASPATRVVTLSRSLFSTLANTETPQPVIAIASIPNRPIPPSSSCVLALDAVRDPGNLGTIVRTARAASVDGIALLPGCVDPFGPKVARASAGLVATIPIEHVRSMAEIVERCLDTGVPFDVLAADSTGSDDYRDVDWKKPVIVVVGNEGAGLSSETLEQTTRRVRIPISADVESLNVSVATALLLFEMRRQRDRDER